MAAVTGPGRGAERVSLALLYGGSVVAGGCVSMGALSRPVRGDGLCWHETYSEHEGAAGPIQCMHSPLSLA